MSNEAQAIALNHSRATGAARLVLIGIANHDGDGGSWPSVNTLARYANVLPRNVQKALITLESLGEIRRHVQRGGTMLTADSHRPNLYEFLLQCPADCDRSKWHRTRKQASIPRPIPGLEPPVASDTPVGSDTPVASDGGRVSVATPAPLSPATPETPLEPSTYVPRTKPSNRASGKAPIWSTEQCPGDWKTGTHVLSVSGKCQHCHERPAAFANPQTGEVL